MASATTLVPLLNGRMHLLVKPWVKSYPVSPKTWCFCKEVLIESH
jgi:hypothetical protein